MTETEATIIFCHGLAFIRILSLLEMNGSATLSTFWLFDLSVSTWQTFPKNCGD